MNELKTVTVDIDSIFQDPENARTHSDEQLEYIAASLKRFGQQKPLIVSKDNVIVAGNGTHLAARDILSWDSISIITTDLSVEEARAYGIADNQIASKSDWDLSTLTRHIKDMAQWNPLQDWKAIGFSNDIIDPLVQEEPDSSTALTDFLEGNNSKSVEDEKPVMAPPIKVTEEQRDIINQAVNIVRLTEGDYTMSEGRAIELISGDFLGGFSHTEEVETV